MTGPCGAAAVQSAAQRLSGALACMSSSLPRALLVIVDGLGDVAITQLRPAQRQQHQQQPHRPQREQSDDGLAGLTPLQSTATPHLDALASQAHTAHNSIDRV